ncbi:TonB-dependent receptor [Paraglaciecola arctica]|uniref:Iron complex outermembrane recepter protein n=1 Tax=Paraglaciecola arctica BSs20135 TaxID=493475 RepID=K6YS50_9ALTE|nr:TonB-dependent receptor [Paraglaciecola arctica]GAC20992.1 iron complex outermembrane recepter protein [Paraglaciecola arctica BSs20135]
MIVFSTFTKSSIALAVITLIHATPSQAQQREAKTAEKSNDIEVISVTSSRRIKSLTEVPMAVSAFDSLTLERANILDIEDVAGMTPGFTLSTYNPVTPQPYIRGVGTNSSSVGDDASVGVFIDDVYAGRAGGFRSDMFDIERVEVLRGPQGSLYGRNVAGGAISVITKDPTDFYEAKLKTTYGSDNLMQLQGMVSGAITDNINGRFAGTIRQRDAWVDNIATNMELRDQDNQSMRGKLDFRLSDNTKLMVIADYSKDDLHGPGARTIKNYTSVFGQAPTTGNAIDKVDMFKDGNAKREIYGISGNLTVEMSDILFTSITAFREQDYSFEDDLFGRYLAPAGLALTNDASENSKQITQEFRLQNLSNGPFEWTAGLYLFNEDIQRIEAWDSSIMYALQGHPELLSRPIWDATNDTTSYAIFGEGSYKINDHWNFTLGGRYTYDKKDFSNNATGAEDLLGFLQESYQVSAEKSWTSFTPKVTVNYFTNSQDMLYFTVSEGYKAGGYNGIAANKAMATTPFDQEKARNYEAGFKARLLDRQLSLNAAVYFLDYSDLQSFTTDLDTGDIRTATGDAEVKGLELDANARIGDGLRLFATLAFTDSEYTSFAIDPLVVGNTLARTPEKSGSAGFNYQWLLANSQTLDLRTDLTYQSRIYYSVNSDAVAAGNSHALLNANITWENLEGWEISVYGKNLTDKEYASHAFSQAGLGFVIEGEPRTFGISVAKMF